MAKHFTASVVNTWNMNMDCSPQTSYRLARIELPHKNSYRTVNVGRDSSVDIATSCGLDGPGIESRCGVRDFPHLSKPSLGPTQLPIYSLTGHYRGKSAGAWRWPAYLWSAEVKENVDLYLHFCVVMVGHRVYFSLIPSLHRTVCFCL
jgi:hypothetical protein